MRKLKNSLTFLPEMSDILANPTYGTEVRPEIKIDPRALSVWGNGTMKSAGPSQREKYAGGAGAALLQICDFRNRLTGLTG